MSRALRAGASALAIVSLSVLGWESFRAAPDDSSPTTHVTLWTAGASITDRDWPDGGILAALPDAAASPDRATRVPDAPYLRRSFPNLHRLTIEGDGVDETDAAALRGLEVTWRRPSARPQLTPSLVSVSAPREISVGQRMHVQGSIRGALGGEPTLILEGPHGSKRTMILPAATDGDIAFEITDESVASAPGAFEWKLRLGPTGEPLVFGTVVKLPQHPRVLMVQSSPTVESGRLQRWLAESGAPVLTRTRVSAEHFRFSSANGPTEEFGSLDSVVLAKYDVVVTHDSALVELIENERAALDTAIRDTGLGLLVIGDSNGKAATARFIPWQLQRIAGGDETEDRRLSRVRLRDGTELREPVPVLAAEFRELQSARRIARDPQDRVLVAAFPCGLGWVARSLVSDTWRWLQGGHPELFATFWSTVLAAVARSGSGEGQWMLDHGSGPIFAGEPLKLSWVSPPDATLSHALVRLAGHANDMAVAVAVKLLRHPTEPTRARAVYYPAQPGWHEARMLPHDRPFAFYVQAKEALPELRAERRRDDTARLAASAPGSPPRLEPGEVRSFRHLLSSWLWLALFVVSAGAVWWKERK